MMESGLRARQAVLREDVWVLESLFYKGDSRMMEPGVQRRRGSVREDVVLQSPVFCGEKAARMVEFWKSGLEKQC